MCLDVYNFGVIIYQITLSLILLIFMPPQHSINTEASTLQTIKRPPHEKDNTNTLVEKTKNSRGK
jgi:hypothetical protein